MSKKKWLKYQKARSSHLKAKYKMEQEAKATSGITIDQDNSGKWLAVRGNVPLSEAFTTQTEAFKWVEKHFPPKG